MKQLSIKNREFVEVSIWKEYQVNEYLACKDQTNTSLKIGNKYLINNIRVYFGDWRLKTDDIVYVSIDLGSGKGIYWYLPSRFEPKSQKFRMNERIRQDFKWLKELKEQQSVISKRISQTFSLYQY